MTTIIKIRKNDHLVLPISKLKQGENSVKKFDLERTTMEPEKKDNRSDGNSETQNPKQEENNQEEDQGEIILDDGLFGMIREFFDTEELTLLNLQTRKEMIPERCLMIVIGSATNNVITTEIKIPWLRGAEPTFLPEHVEIRYLVYDLIKDSCRIATLCITDDGYNAIFTWGGDDGKIFPVYSEVPNHVVSQTKFWFWTKIFDTCCDKYGWYKTKTSEDD